MKKQIALALSAALLVFPITPGLALAETTSTGTTSITSTTTQTSDTPTTNETTSTVTTTSDSTDTTNPTTEDATVQDQDGETVDPGTLPDSPFYWFQTLIEKVQVALTFDPVKKAEVVEQQAVENLAEAEALIEKGDIEEAEKTLTVYSEKIERAQAFLDQLEDPNSETAQKVQVALTKVNTNNMVVLGGLLEKLPPQAAQKLALNIVRSVEKAVAKVEKMENKKIASDSETTTLQTSSVDNTTDAGETEDQEQLKKQAKQALEQFQIDLGLKKADHDSKDKEHAYDNKDHEENDEDDDSNLTKQQQQNQTQQAVQQPQSSQVNQSVKIPAAKDHEDQDKDHNEQKDGNEKGHRD